MKKRIFFPNGLIAWFGYAVMALPYLLAIGFAINGAWWALLIAPVGSYYFYAIICHRFCARFISIGDGFVCASRSFTPIDPIQHACKVSLSRIVIADFCFVQGDSKGNEIPRA